MLCQINKRRKGSSKGSTKIAAATLSRYGFQPSWHAAYPSTAQRTSRTNSYARQPKSTGLPVSCSFPRPKHPWREWREGVKCLYVLIRAMPPAKHLPEANARQWCCSHNVLWVSPRTKEKNRAVCSSTETTRRLMELRRAYICRLYLWHRRWHQTEMRGASYPTSRATVHLQPKHKWPGKHSTAYGPKVRIDAFFRGSNSSSTQFAGNG